MKSDTKRFVAGVLMFAAAISFSRFRGASRALSQKAHDWNLQARLAAVAVAVLLGANCLLLLDAPSRRSTESEQGL